MAHDKLDIASLASYLRQASRECPVVILTVAPGQLAPYVTPQEVVRMAGGRADVVTLPTHELTRSLTEHLDDPAAGVYQGACRVYPPGSEWETEARSSPPRMARDAAEIAALPKALAADIRAALAPKPRPKQSPASLQSPIPPRTPKARGASVSAVMPPATGLPGAIESPTVAEALAAHLHSSTRQLPTVVVSRASGASEAYADVEQLHHDLAGLAEVFEIATLDASWAFSRAVPDKCQVYGGAGRVYPVGTEWELDPYLSPLRFAYGKVDRVLVTRQLIADALGMASRQSLRLPVPETQPLPVSGTVMGVAGERGLVKLDDRSTGVLWPELVVPGIAADRVFAKRMRVHGELEPDSRRIDVSGMRRTADEALAAYRAGDTILARVTEVASGSCTLELFPGFTRSVPATDVADEPTDLRELMSVGEVLPVWFGGRDEESGEWFLSPRDAADAEEAAPAPSLLVGGPPWLVPTDPSAAAAGDARGDDDAGEAISAEPSAALVASLQRDNHQLGLALKASEATVATLTRERNTLRTKLREARRRKVGGGPGHLDGVLFESDDEQLNFEIQVAWAQMVPASEKKDLPLKAWSYGPRFFETWRQVEGISREKVVKVLVDVLTGRAADLMSRELHQLRSGKGGNDAPMTRNGGEVCWRVSLQTNTPSARRLHYWACADGSIELSSIRLHDDFAP